MTEKEQVKRTLPHPTVNPFGFPSPARCVNKIAEHDVIIKTKLDFDPATGKTTVNQEEKIELYPLIQSYKDQCGMEYVQKLIRTGYATADKFADDGKHGGEVPASTDINDAYRASMAAKSSSDKLSAALGLDLSTATPEQIQAKLAEIYQAQQKQPVNESKEAE